LSLENAAKTDDKWGIFPSGIFHLLLEKYG